MKESRGKQIVMGICTVAAGIWLGSVGLDSMRTGVPVPAGARGGTPLDGWIVLPMGGFLVFLGLCVIGVGLGYVKLKRPE